MWCLPANPCRTITVCYRTISARRQARASIAGVSAVCHLVVKLSVPPVSRVTSSTWQARTAGSEAAKFVKGADKKAAEAEKKAKAKKKDWKAESNALRDAMKASREVTSWGRDCSTLSKCGMVS